MAEHADTASGQVNDSKDQPQTPAAQEHVGQPQSTLNDANIASKESDAPATGSEGDDSTSAVADDEFDAAHSPHEQPRQVSLQWAATISLAAVVLVLGMSGWLGYRAYQSHQTAARDQMFVQVARQGAIDLTTIDWEHSDNDVQRILDASTGTFRDDFAARSGPFVDAVKKVQSKSVGTVIDAGLESISDDQAQILVAVSVKTSMAGTPEQEPRSWRMRISVQKTGNGNAKLSNVAFVP